MTRELGHNFNFSFYTNNFQFFTKRQQAFKTIIGLSTGESYNLEELSDGLQKQNIYELMEISEDVEDDVLPIRAKYKVNDEPREIFLFREGSIVCWNCSQEEIENLLDFVSNYQLSPYDKALVLKEKEEVDYLPLNDIQKSKFIRGTIHLKNDDKTKLYDQYACRYGFGDWLDRLFEQNLSSLILFSFWSKFAVTRSQCQVRLNDK